MMDAPENWPKVLNPGPELLRAVRTGFVARNRTLNGWCTDNQVNPSNARVALLGGWRGPKAQDLIARIKRAAGLQ